MIRSFLLALQFLTRIPTPQLSDTTDREIGLSQYYYPVIGLIIGLLLLFAANIISLSSSSLEAALLLSFWVLLTGALHIDGLADCADAWVGGYGDKEKTLTIMKDPQSGPVAVTLIVCVLIIKFAALEAIVSTDQLSALILAPVIARSLLPLLFHTTPYVRPNGLGATLSQTQSLPLLLTALLLSSLLSVYLLGISALIVVTISLLMLVFIRSISLKRLDGFTGDVAGALVELVEIAVLVAILCL